MRPCSRATPGKRRQAHRGHRAVERRALPEHRALCRPGRSAELIPKPRRHRFVIDESEPVPGVKPCLGGRDVGPFAGLQAGLRSDPAARTVGRSCSIPACTPSGCTGWRTRCGATASTLIWPAGQPLSRFVTGIEIHPGARPSDPASSSITAWARSSARRPKSATNVTLYHNVTLGGVSWEKVKRHPTLEDHVVVGAGAQVLGPIYNRRTQPHRGELGGGERRAAGFGGGGRAGSHQEAQRRSAPDADREDLQHDRLPTHTRRRCVISRGGWWPWNTPCGNYNSKMIRRWRTPG